MSPLKSAIFSLPPFFTVFSLSSHLNQKHNSDLKQAGCYCMLHPFFPKIKRELQSKNRLDRLL